MALLTPDGKPYRASGSLQQYDPANPQIALFNLWDEDAIRIGGTPVYYYEQFIPTGEIDPDYFEARGKLYSNHPIELWALYEPLASQNYQNQFGITSMNDIQLECNYQAVLRAIGHPPKVGSRVYTPHLGENWEIVQNNLEEFKLWTALRLKIVCKQFQESVTTSSGRVTEKSPNVPKAL